MSDETPPMIRSNLPGGQMHPGLIRADELEDPENGVPTLVRQSMPSTCQRVRQTQRLACPSECPGRQRDGGCLLDIVKAAQAAGVEWAFEIDTVEPFFWDYAGDPIPGLITERRNVGEVHTRWEEGYGPQSWEPEIVKVPQTVSFQCPHCGRQNTKPVENVNYWCDHCGKNAKMRS
jgi:hypothetical protein